jgi:hypothetical protein
MSEGRYKESEMGLPPLFPLRGFEGSVSEWIDCLYWQYRCIVGDAGISLWGKPVVGTGTQGPDGRSRRFWHLISEADGTCGARRVLNLDRCAALPRVWAVLEQLASGDTGVHWWREGRREVLVAAPDFSVHVVLREHADKMKLVTAYPVQSLERRARLREKAAASWALGKSRTRHCEHPLWQRESEASRTPAAGLRRGLSALDMA